MYRILFLYEIQENDFRVIDYLQLGGYSVWKEELKCVEQYGSLLEQCDLILIESNQLESCFSTCEKIRRKTQIPIVVLSGNDDEWEKIKLFRIGIDDYLVKPYLQGELMARIQAHIERYKRLMRPFGMIEVGDLKINAFNRKVYLKGIEVEMRLKEFDVLLYLAQNMNQVVTKEDIYVAVWKDDLADGYYSSVAVHIRRVREKIEENVDNPRYIETVWGVGYRFRR